MKSEQKEFKKSVEKAKRILIITHKSPDLDAFCSALLLKTVLSEIYAKKHIEIQAKNNPSMRIPGMQEINTVSKIDSRDFDLVIVTDAGDLSLCLDENDLVDTSDSVIYIDHHDTFFEDNKGKILINNNMSSATEEVYSLLKNIYGKKFKLNSDTAHLVQYGIVADTGRFLYDITTPNTHRVFADAADVASVDLEDFAYRNAKFPREATSAVIEYLKTLTMEKDMAYMYIDRETLEGNLELKQGANEAQSFLRDKYLRFIQGIHWGFIVKPDMNSKDTWFVSFRSTKGYQDVRVIAEELGGGGHTYASGVSMRASSLEEVLDKVLGVVKKYL